MNARLRPAALVRSSVLVLLALLLLALAGGFGWFTHLALRTAPAFSRADGIVVLTGGSGRIDAGLRLLAAGAAPELLVSGVRPGTDAARLIRAAGMAEMGLTQTGLLRRISLGDRAISTRGNAIETRAWVRRNRLRRVIVVTAFYHMPRALAVLHRFVPRTDLVPVPVTLREMKHLSAPRLLFLLADEYVKYLAVRASLPGPGPDLRPAAAPAGAAAE